MDEACNPSMPDRLCLLSGIVRASSLITLSDTIQDLGLSIVRAVTSRQSSSASNVASCSGESFQADLNFAKGPRPPVDWASDSPYNQSSIFRCSAILFIIGQHCARNCTSAAAYWHWAAESGRASQSELVSSLLTSTCRRASTRAR